MKKKKAILAFALAGTLVAGWAGMAVLAHGHGGGCHKRQASYGLCDVEDCHMVDVHEHDGIYYCGHFIGDGHDYHEVCGVKGCTLTKEHEHDGVLCLPCKKDGADSAAGCPASQHKSRHCR